MILEKAWAKVHGGYLNINSGLTREALHDLTGAPCLTYFNDENTDEERWNIIYSSDQSQYIMAAGTHDLIGNGQDAQEQKTGIVGSHAYSMLAAVELVEDRGNWRVLKNGEQTKKNTVRLVKLRNPWGKGEWKGDWCDQDKKWSASLKSELGHTNENDGVFFMPFSAFNELFSDFQICYYKDDYKYACTRLNTEQNQHCYFSFNVTKPGDYFFSLNQINKRFFRKDKNYKYSSCTMTVGRLEADGKVVYVGAAQKADKESWFESTCVPGKYICSIYTPWISFVDEITLSSYGPEEVTFSALEEVDVPKNYYQKLVASKCVNDKTGWKDYASQGHHDIMYKFEHGSDGFGFFNFVNDSETTSLTVTIDFTKCQNLRPLYPYTFNNPMLIVPPKTTESFVYFMVDTPSSIAFRMLTTFKKSAQEIVHVVKREGNKFIRKYKNKDVGIYVYALVHAEGTSWEYENSSKDYMLDEAITFNLHNAWIEGSNDDTAKIILMPGQTKVINIVNGSGDNKGAGTVDNLEFNVRPC